MAAGLVCVFNSTLGRFVCPPALMKPRAGVRNFVFGAARPLKAHVPVYSGEDDLEGCLLEGVFELNERGSPTDTAREGLPELVEG